MSASIPIGLLDHSSQAINATVSNKRVAEKRLKSDAYTTDTLTSASATTTHSFNERLGFGPTPKISTADRIFPIQEDSKLDTKGADRYIPSRTHMLLAGSYETFSTAPPETSLQQQVVVQFFPYYSNDPLQFRRPQKYKIPAAQEPLLSKSQKWQFPKVSQKISVPPFDRDFYMNNLDWGSKCPGFTNASACYIWDLNRKDPQTCGVNLNFLNEITPFTAIKFKPGSSDFAAGDAKSCIMVFDAETEDLSDLNYDLDSHRIYSMDWRSQNELTVGTVSKIHHLDVRAPRRPIASLSPSYEQICSLTWEGKDKTLLAVGSNDNTVKIFDNRWYYRPLHEHSHNAAVKALKWIPNQPQALLLSGGGSLDREFQVVDVNRNVLLSKACAGAQICSAVFLDNQYFIAGLGKEGLQVKNLQMWRFSSEGGAQQLELLAEVDEPQGRVLNVAKDPNSPTVCALSEEGSLVIWRMEKLMDRIKSGARSTSSFNEKLSTIR